MENRIVFSIWIIAAFLIGLEGYDWQKELGLLPESWPRELRHWLAQVVWPSTPAILTLIWLYGRKKLSSELGLELRKLRGLALPLIATLPMLLGYGFNANWQFDMTWRVFLHSCVLAALIEEVVFRGFLFGQLFRRGGWGFLPAGLLAAVIFGTMHLYQSDDLGDMIGIFLVTGIGSLWFGWLYIEWNYNLWVPIGFHFLMNFYWSVFDAGNNALGGLEANIYRGAVIILSIVLTRYWKKRQNQDRIINAQRMWKTALS